MPIKEPENFSLFSYLLVLIMTLLGAIASYAYRILNGEPFRWSILFLQAIVAIFAGALVLLAANYYHWAAEFAGGIAGLSGWSGAEFIKTLEKRFLTRVNGENHDN
ncbi:phage holin family protein [Budviciaceae bacterium BWR-B9]|uniref:Phage holin family protein n=1 Tax=Limnobaculum allomyrinae TaxID=2791986 RepID=A0ABS1IP65_9GAMM|nr:MULTISPECIES: phage holin family protein [Limnobaculum]MBK5143367.1 phage holin family protein [Limnobaculum allomyrinae]MBV7691255.1 phage holin family protein [Limnobaculum sp. M2-1]